MAGVPYGADSQAVRIGRRATRTRAAAVSRWRHGPQKAASGRGSVGSGQVLRCVETHAQLRGILLPSVTDDCKRKPEKSWGTFPVVENPCKFTYESLAGWPGFGRLSGSRSHSISDGVRKYQPVRSSCEPTSPFRHHLRTVGGRTSPKSRAACPQEMVGRSRLRFMVATFMVPKYDAPEWLCQESGGRKVVARLLPRRTASLALGRRHTFQPPCLRIRPPQHLPRVEDLAGSAPHSSSQEGSSDATSRATAIRLAGTRCSSSRL